MLHDPDENIGVTGGMYASGGGVPITNHSAFILKWVHQHGLILTLLALRDLETEFSQYQENANYWKVEYRVAQRKLDFIERQNLNLHNELHEAKNPNRQVEGE